MPMAAAAASAAAAPALMIHPLSTWKQRWDSYVILLVRRRRTPVTAGRIRQRCRHFRNMPAHTPGLPCRVDMTPLPTRKLDTSHRLTFLPTGALHLHFSTAGSRISALRVRLSD